MQRVVHRRRRPRKRDPLSTPRSLSPTEEEVGGSVIPVQGTGRTKHTKLRVLFVCPGNTSRSILCHAWATVYGFDAESAGTFPGLRVAPEAVQVMQEVGIDISAMHPRILDRSRLQAFDLVVSIGGALQPPIHGARIEAWHIVDPKGLPIEGYRALRAQTEKLVKGLAKRMRAKSELLAKTP